MQIQSKVQMAGTRLKIEGTITAIDSGKYLVTWDDKFEGVNLTSWHPASDLVPLASRKESHACARMKPKPFGDSAS